GEPYDAVRGAFVLCEAGGVVQGAGNLYRARSGLCGPGVRWVSRAQHSGGAGREGYCGRVLYAVEELQHAGMAGWVYGGELEAGGGAGTDQELLRLWDVYSDSGGLNCRARRTAGLCDGD